MIAFFKCVARAALDNGVKGLADLVPGGSYVYAVAADAWKKYREQAKDAEQRAEIQSLARATFEEAQAAAAQAVREAIAERGVSVSERDAIPLELWLSAVPEATRASLRRPADPDGRSVPGDFSLREPEDVLQLLPLNVPKFVPGNPLPGRPGWVLDRLLGSGGFGEVWYARNTRLSGKLKRLAPSLRRAARLDVQTGGKGSDRTRTRQIIISKLPEAGRAGSSAPPAPPEGPASWPESGPPAADDPGPGDRPGTVPRSSDPDLKIRPGDGPADDADDVDDLSRATDRWVTAHAMGHTSQGGPGYMA